MENETVVTETERYQDYEQEFIADIVSKCFGNRWKTEEQYLESI
jgi:hypothetical protein